MIQDRNNNNLSEFLQYLASHEDIEQSLPALTTLGQELGISVASLREQLEVARALGFVDVRPRIGIRRQPYSFSPAVRQSLRYALALDKSNFIAFADLRRHIETAYWHEAVNLLTPEDHSTLKALVTRAWEKLRGSPIEIPHPEHRELHLTIYRRLNNPFVTGLLLTYWDAYETVGLNFFTDYNYLTEVWNYHQKMVEAICANDIQAGYIALTEHSDLINQLISSANNK
jgi:DNA-binding FadR family transcriptional regulator